MTDPNPAPFHDLEAWIRLPRLGGLALSPDGTSLVTTVQTLDPAGTAYVSALWWIDPTGARRPHRLTSSTKGESGPVFAPDGSLLFTSARPDPDATPGPDEDAPAALMQLPARGGEARVIGTRRGGFGAVAVARDAGTVVVVAPTLPGSADEADDTTRRKARADRKVAAMIHDSYPVRYWDADLGPEQNRLLVADGPPPIAVMARSAAPLPRDDAPVETTNTKAGTLSEDRLQLRHLTPAPGRALDEPDIAVAPDGTFAVTTWFVGEQGGRRLTLQRIDLADGNRTTLLDDPHLEGAGPTVSPDSTQVAAVVETMSTVNAPPRFSLVVIDATTGTARTLPTTVTAPPSTPCWTPDSTALIITADEDGRAPIFRIDVATGSTIRLTADAAAFGDVVVSPDGRTVYAVRSAMDQPPTVVRLDAVTPDQTPTPLRVPVEAPDLPGHLEEVTATAADGTPLRAWLCLPKGADADHPAPFLLWIHGGPLASWNAWSWRWNPWLMVAAGYAVLLPDPALSTGYGEDFITRGWGAWGAGPYTDLMTMTDVVVARADVDDERTAAMGGSFGGYMANWIAGHTDRFDAIVTHASLWALDQFGPTTDAYHYWRRELSPEMAAANSPHLHVDAITTPMLVIHGDKDYRVPIGDGLRLWAELTERAPKGPLPHRFLLFPDENHWILKPQNARVWYQTVLAFLAWHVQGEEWSTPDLLT